MTRPITAEERRIVAEEQALAADADAPESRRALYVAPTRAVHQAWLLAAGPWSRVLPAWLVER